MGRAIVIYSTILLGIVGIGFAAGQAVHNHGDTQPEDAQGSTSAPSGSTATPGTDAAASHAGMKGMDHNMMGHGMTDKGMPDKGAMDKCMVGREAPVGMGAFASLHAALQRPLARGLFGVFLLPEMQTELGLSADQVNQLRLAKQDLLAKGDGFGKQIAAKQKELDTMFAPDTSKGQQVKTLLEQIAALQAQQQYVVYTSSRKMKALLRDEQRNRLEAMKPDELHQAAMTHLTLGDLSRAMQFLSAGL